MYIYSELLKTSHVFTLLRMRKRPLLQNWTIHSYHISIIVHEAAKRTDSIVSKRSLSIYCILKVTLALLFFKFFFTYKG